MTGPLLAFALDGPGRERLVVDADGHARYLVLQAAHPAWADRVGLFATRLSPERAESAAMIARDLIAAVPRTRGRTGPVVTATIDDQDATHPLDGPGHAASDLLSDLIELVREHPVAVVSFGVEVINDVDLRLRWESIGSAEVDLRIARDSVRVSTRTDGAWMGVWRSNATTRLALVAAPQGFVDGVNSAASLEPGTVARAMVPGALAEADAATDLVSTELAGWLDIAALSDESSDDGPFEVAGALPGQWPIRLTATTPRR